MVSGIASSARTRGRVRHAMESPPEKTGALYSMSAAHRWWMGGKANGFVGIGLTSALRSRLRGVGCFGPHDPGAIRKISKRLATTIYLMPRHRRREKFSETHDRPHGRLAIFVHTSYRQVDRALRRTLVQAFKQQSRQFRVMRSLRHAEKQVLANGAKSGSGRGHAVEDTPLEGALLLTLIATVASKTRL